MTFYTWHVTCDMWHMTHDTWHVTCCGGWTFSQNFSSVAPMVCDLWYLEDWEEKAHWLTGWMVLLSASVKRVGVSSMRDFFIKTLGGPSSHVPVLPDPWRAGLHETWQFPFLHSCVLNKPLHVLKMTGFVLHVIQITPLVVVITETCISSRHSQKCVNLLKFRTE